MASNQQISSVALSAKARTILKRIALKMFAINADWEDTKKNSAMPITSK